MEYYMSEPIDEAITAIRSKAGEILYLIEGSKRTFLFDDVCCSVSQYQTNIKAL